MASPTKERKDSQESKLTSTPQRFSRGVVPSPDLSRIASDASSDQQVVASQASSVNFAVSTASTHVSLLTERCFEVGTDLNYDEFFSNLPKVKRAGRIWKLYQPLEDDTLYSRILSEPEIAEEHVIEFLRTLTTNPKDGVYHILRLCLDLCGYQKFDWVKYYKFPEVNFKQIFEAMTDEHCKAEIFTTKHYLLAEPESHLAHVFKMGIYNFVTKLIIKAEEKGVINEPNFKIFFKFVDGMIGHKIRPVVHTGAILGMKIVSAMCMINNEILNSSSFVSLLDHENTKRYKQIEKYMDILFLQIRKVCLLNHEKSESLKIVCAHEMLLWMAYLPDMYVNELDCMKMLRKFIHDDSKKVRLAALDTYQKILEDLHLTRYQQIPEFFEAIEGRFYDVDRDVTLKALETYRTAIEHYPSHITAESLKLLVKLAYDQNCLYAKAAAPCIMEIMNQTNITEEKMLLRLVNMADSVIASFKPLIVEAFIDCMPELTNWQRFVQLLSNNHVPIGEKITLCEIFAESVHQTLVGVSTKPRFMSRKVVDISPEDHEEIALVFLPVVAELLAKFHAEPEILRDLLKVVLLIKVEVHYAKFYLSIVEVTNRIFAVNTDQTLLETAADVLLLLSNKNIALEAVKALISWFAKKFNEGVESTTDHSQVVSKIAILSQRFDLYNYGIPWEALSDNWDPSTPNVAASLMISCKWYLIWRLKKSSPDKEAISTLIFYFNGFLRELGNCIKKSSLKIAAFSELSDFIVKFTDEVVKIRKTRKEFEVIKVNFEDKDNDIMSDMQEIIEGFVVSVVVNTKVPLKDRKRCVENFIALVFYTALPIQCLSIVFKHFKSSHDEYGKIIDSAIKQLLEAGAVELALVVTDTLTSTFEQLVAKHGAFDARSAEARNVIRGLIGQFSASKEVQNPKVAGFILFFSVNFALKNVPEHFPFLTFVVSFIPFVQDEKKILELRDRLKKNIPKANEKDASVLYFAKHLNKKIHGEETADTTLVPKALFKKPRKTAPKNKENKEPKKRSRKPAGNENKRPKAQQNVSRSKRVSYQENSSSDTDDSDIVSIHDSSSDDLSHPLSHMLI